MSLADLQRAFNLIESNLDLAHFAGPQSRDRICKAEQLLAVAFPPTYLHFLLRLGCGDIGGEEFYGIVNQALDLPRVPNGLWMTIQRRQKAGLSPSCVVVCATGHGPEYIIDTSLKNPEGDSPVLLWWPNAPDASRVRVADDFGEFFFTMVSEVVESWRSEEEFED